MMMIAALAVLCMIPFSSASWGWGPCKRFDMVKDADLDKYYGTWYEIVSDSTFFWGKGGSCTAAQYTEVEGKDYFEVVNSAVKKDKWVSYDGKAKARKDGSLGVKFFWFSPYAGYDIIETDYKKYSIVHSCENYLFFHHSINWLLARKPNYSPSKAQIDTMMELGTKEKDLKYTNQTSCPPLPSSDSN